MWDYIAQTRQNELRSQADARRLARALQGSHRQPLARQFRLLLAAMSSRLLTQRPAATQSLISPREMQSCVDA